MTQEILDKKYRETVELLCAVSIGVMNRKSLLRGIDTLMIRKTFESESDLLYKSSILSYLEKETSPGVYKLMKYFIKMPRTLVNFSREMNRHTLFPSLAYSTPSSAAPAPRPGAPPIARS